MIEKKLTIVFEKGDDNDLWGRVSAENAFTIVEVGQNPDEIITTLRMLVADYLAHEGQQNAEWKHVKIEDIVFDYACDISDFFDTYPVVKISVLADLAGINQSLMRQYARGIKFPSIAQTEKIQKAVQQLGQTLQQVAITSPAFHTT